jgi:hypothetical protein
MAYLLKKLVGGQIKKQKRQNQNVEQKGQKNQNEKTVVNIK